MSIHDLDAPQSPSHEPGPDFEFGTGAGLDAAVDGAPAAVASHPSKEDSRSTWLHRLGLLLMVLGGGAIAFAVCGVLYVIYSETRNSFDDSSFVGVVTFILVGGFCAVLIGPAWLLGRKAYPFARRHPVGAGVLALLSALVLLVVPLDGILTGIVNITAYGLLALSMIALGGWLREEFPDMKKVARIESARENELNALVDEFGVQGMWIANEGLDPEQFRGHEGFVRDADAFEQIGLPGENLHEGVGGGLEAASTEQGQAGEAKCAARIAELAEQYPGITLINSVKVPGLERADIDHVLIHGNSVVTIDSKHFSGDTYTWYDEKIVPFPPVAVETAKRSASVMPLANEKVDALIPDGTDLYSMVWVYHPDGDEVVIAGDPQPGALPILTGERDGFDRLEHMLSATPLDDGGALEGPAALRHQQIVDALLPLAPEHARRRHDRNRRGKRES